LGAFFAAGRKKPGFAWLRFRSGPVASRRGCSAPLQSLARLTWQGYALLARFRYANPHSGIHGILNDAEKTPTYYTGIWYICRIGQFSPNSGFNHRPMAEGKKC
jgi:hypothetical protein